MSNIDPSKPQEGFATTESVRLNFQAAKDEIEALVLDNASQDGRIDNNSDRIDDNSQAILENNLAIQENASDIADNSAAIALLDGLPIGSILQWATDTPPANWFFCDGSAIPTNRPTLIALLGANTPNLSNAFIRGASGTREPLTTQAEIVGNHGHTASASSSFAGNALPGHAHTNYLKSETFSYAGGQRVGSDGGGFWLQPTAGGTFGTNGPSSSNSAGTPSGNVTTNVTVNATAAGENRPANTALWYMVYGGPPE